MAIDRLWQKYEDTLPAAVGPLGKDRYMDDIDSGAGSREEVDEQVRQIEECLKHGGFKTKFVAYSGEEPPEAATSDGVHIGVLGLRWDTKYDEFGLGYGSMNMEKKVRGSKAAPKQDVTAPQEW